MSNSFHILVVGVTNDCRSAMAERHLRYRFDSLLGPAAKIVDVSSAGVRAHEDAPMDALTARELVGIGGSPSGFAARQMSRVMMQRADLVLTVNRALRSRVLEDEPTALRRTFTLREFATLAQLLQSPGSPEEFVAKAAGHRWAVGLDAYDLVDAAGGSQRRHHQLAAQVADASGAICGLWSQALALA